MLIAQRPTLTEESINPQRSRFVIEPLEPGFGYTLGNSLRRTLLSSIPGAAVTSVRISGALHEFTTLPGVVEDVTEILLNIKGIVLTSEYDEPVVMYLRKSGNGEVTAGDITPPAGVTIANPDQHIATLADDGELEIEFTVERGRGYVPAQMNKQDTDEIGRIPVDSIYSPVLKVSYKVEATRVEQRTDFDKLILDVETKPAISPRDAVASAGSTLVELFGLCRELNVQAEGVEVGPAPVAEETNPEMAVPIEAPQPHAAQLQLPQARGHPHDRRACRSHRAGSAGYSQFRYEVDRRGQGQAAVHGTVAEVVAAGLRYQQFGRWYVLLA